MIRPPRHGRRGPNAALGSHRPPLGETPRPPRPPPLPGVWGTTIEEGDEPPVASLDHLVGEGKQLRWDVEAECLCGFEIDDKFKPSSSILKFETYQAA
jgi:hypothetical protein